MSHDNEVRSSPDHSHAESWSEPIRMREAIDRAASIVRDDPGRSLELAGEGLRIARSLEEPHFIALALRIIGTTLIVTGDYRQAVDRLREGVRVRETIDNPEEWIDLHYLIGSAATHLGDYETAAARCSAGLKRAEEIGWEEGRCRGLNNLGLIAFRTNRYDDALTFLEQSHAISRLTGDREAEGKAIRNIGSVREHQGEIAQAITCYSQALEIFIELDLAPELPGLYNDLAGVWCIVGEFPRAFDAYRNALEQFQKFENAKGIAFVLNNLGHLYLDLGQDDQALEHFRDSLAIKEEIGIDLDLKDIQFEAHEELSNVLQDTGEFREALEHYRQSRELRHAFSSAESEERLKHLMIPYNLDRERQGRKIAEQQSEIHRLKTERLSQDVEHRTRELAATAMYLVRKNDLLQKLPPHPIAPQALSPPARVQRAGGDRFFASAKNQRGSGGGRRGQWKSIARDPSPPTRSQHSFPPPLRRSGEEGGPRQRETGWYAGYGSRHS